MSKDDFRDRLKSYSSEPEHSDWAKMQQLLDADKDNRKAIVWWKYGVLLALVLIPASILLSNYSFGKEEVASINNQDKSSIAKNDPSHPIVNQAKEQVIDNNDSKEVLQDNSETKIDQPSIATVKQDRQIKGKSSQNSFINKKSKVDDKKEVIQVDQKTIKPKALFSIPHANTSSQLNATSTISKTITTRASPLPITNENALVSIGSIKEVKTLSPARLSLAERTLPELTFTPFTKVYPLTKSNPWYLVSAIGVKYPIVDISTATKGSLIPSQKFFPSYLAELAVGKHFGPVSVEGGAAASLYQYKLGKVFTDEDLAYEQSAISGGQSGQENTLIEENTFIINKFAVLSPYLRLQYSIDLKKDFVLGIHSSVMLNRKINLANQVVSDQFADNNIPAIELDKTGEAFLNSTNTNLNYDLGFSLEKLFAKRARIAMDISYSFASGILEEGFYSVLRETAAESQGVYKITGIGPKVKFRYYLNLGS